MGKRLLVFGPPGVGKGTHSRRLAVDLGIPHVATGDLLRQAGGGNGRTQLGQQAGELMRRGELVPDTLAVAILEERLARPDAAAGFLLDGFPRTLPQAEVLVQRLTGAAAAGDAVLSLEAPEALLVERLSGRETCAGCAAVFNRFLRPASVEGVCDQCGGKLVQRVDDTREAALRRLASHHAKTEPVLTYLGAQGWPVRTVSTVGDVDQVYGRIREAVAS